VTTYILLKKEYTKALHIIRIKKATNPTNGNAELLIKLLVKEDFIMLDTITLPTNKNPKQQKENIEKEITQSKKLNAIYLNMSENIHVFPRVYTLDILI